MTAYLVLLSINLILILLVAVYGKPRKYIHPLYVIAGTVIPLAMPILFILVSIDMYLEKRGCGDKP